MSEQEWRDGLKVGDEVALPRQRDEGHNILTVTGVAPAHDGLPYTMIGESCE